MNRSAPGWICLRRRQDTKNSGFERRQVVLYRIPDDFVFDSLVFMAQKVSHPADALPVRSGT